MKKVLKTGMIIAMIGIEAAAAGVLFFATLAPGMANAQLFTYGASTTTSSSTMSVTTTTATSSISNTSSSLLPSPTLIATPTITITPVLVAQPIPMTAGGYIQFNGLVVNSIGSAALPTTISASVPTSTIMTCESFPTEFSDVGTPTACPTAPTATIEVTSATQLLLADRSSAVLANITPGDSINVFGYYDGSSMIQSNVLRDISKPTTSMITTSGNGGTMTIADLQAEINQIQILLAQLIAQIDGLGTNSTTVSTTTGAGGPLIPYNPSSTIQISTSTIISTSSIIY